MIFYKSKQIFNSQTYLFQFLVEFLELDGVKKKYARETIKSIFRSLVV